MWDLRFSRLPVWRLEPSGIERREVLLEYTDVSEERTHSIITVMMEAVRASETSVYSKQ
jgi:primosomal replication protein N